MLKTEAAERVSKLESFIENIISSLRNAHKEALEEYRDVLDMPYEEFQSVYYGCIKTYHASLEHQKQPFEPSEQENIEPALKPSRKAGKGKAAQEPNTAKKPRGGRVTRSQSILAVADPNSKGMESLLPQTPLKVGKREREMTRRITLRNMAQIPTIVVPLADG